MLCSQQERYPGPPGRMSPMSRLLAHQGTCRVLMVLTFDQQAALGSLVERRIDFAGTSHNSPPVLPLLSQSVPI